MKALSFWQPWGTLVVIGAKGVETRGRNTHFRGRIAVHAASANHYGIFARITKAELEHFRAAGVLDYPRPPLGAIVGTVEIYECVPIEALYRNPTFDTPQERAFGDWSPGRFGLLLRAPVVFEKLIPAKGAQGLFNWDEVAAGLPKGGTRP